jgi:RNA polymerase sigma-70 factor, ECF subfamily
LANLKEQLSQPDFDTVYDEQADFVFSLSRRLSKTKSDAEDLFQESFLKAFRFFPKFRGGSVKGWLRKIVVTTNISRHRGKKNQPVLPLEEHEGWKESIPDEGAGPAELAELEEQKCSLQVALGQLGEDARTVLVLREIEGLDYEEIAQTLDIPKGTVRSRLARGREALRRVLEQSDG